MDEAELNDALKEAGFESKFLVIAKI